MFCLFVISFIGYSFETVDFFSVYTHSGGRGGQNVKCVDVIYIVISFFVIFFVIFWFLI